MTTHEHMTYEQKLAIAKSAYKEIKAVMDKFESIKGVCCCWDECIAVDDELFHHHQMSE